MHEATSDDARAAFKRIRAAHLDAVSAALEDHVGRLSWSRDQIERYQTARLRSLLGHARERSPFHAERLRVLDLASVTAASLSVLPMMIKRDAQEHWDDIITVPRLDRERAEGVLASQPWFSYTADDQQIFSSGGSSGVRGVYVWDWDFFVSTACLAWRNQAAEERRHHQSPTRLAVLEAGTPPHASTPLFDIPTAAGMDTVVIGASAPIDDIIAAVLAARPTHMVGYPSIIGQVARSCLARNLDVKPVRVSTNSEPLLDEDRQAIMAAWSAEIHNLWGSTEIGVQAVGCGRGEGLHVCEDEVILERVDDDGMPVSADEPAARTLATSLTNRTFPFIRYDLGDQVNVLPGQCACGSAYSRIADIGGRRDDDFRYPSATVPASAFRYVLGTNRQILEYQVRQTADGADVLVVGSADTDEVAASLVASLSRFGLAHPAIGVRIVDGLQRNGATGKLLRFVPLAISGDKRQ